jgi:hypothetical protein
VLKRIILVCGVTLLAVLVLGSTAWASHVPFHQDVAVDTQQATFGPLGSVVVSGTIVCEGSYDISTEVRQIWGGRYNLGYGFTSGECLSGEPTPWDMVVFAERPYRRGSIAVLTFASALLCDPDTGQCVSGSDRDLDEFRL